MPGITNGEERRPGARPTAAMMPDQITDRAQHQPQNTVQTRPNGSVSFRKAVKRDAKLRLAVSGPSGSGKTYTLLKLATELGGRVAVIDTEHGSASKYADQFEFDVLELDSYDPAILPSLIEQVGRQGYATLVIDSLSHFWNGVDGELDQVDKITASTRSNNSWAAWRDVTPKHNRMVDAILRAPVHVLASMRVKTEWVVEKDEKGKVVPRKVGLNPVMKDGIEYEFDVCGDMDHENTLGITKSRCPKISGAVYRKPGVDLAAALKAWLGGSPPSKGTIAGSNMAGNAIPNAPAESVDPVEMIELDVGSVLNDMVSLPAPAPSAVPEELASIWRRMCSPRGVVKMFDELKAAIEQLAGSTGTAEYHRVLRQHGVGRPKDFTSTQPARLCAKDVYGLLMDLRSDSQESQLDATHEAGATDSESGKEK